MASVRLTRELKETIKRKASDAFETADPEPKAGHELQQAVKDGVANSNHQKYMGKIVALFDQEVHAKRLEDPNVNEIYKSALSDSMFEGNLIPKLESRDHVVLYNSHATKRQPTDVPVSIKFDIPIKWYSTDAAYYTNSPLYLDMLNPDDLLKIVPLRDKLRDDLQAWENRKTAFKKTIKDTLENSNTIKQALEIFPGLESFIPPEKLQKMNEKVTRKQRAQKVREKTNIDTTAANQVILTAKIVGG